MLYFLEEFLNRTLLRSFCLLHMNEMPFRHIMEKLDGQASQGKWWSSTSSKLILNVDTLNRMTDFEPIPFLETFVNIRENIF